MRKEEYEEPCDDDGKCCEWIDEEDYDDEGNMFTWNTFCRKCYRDRDYRKRDRTELLEAQESTL